ncbi:MAG: hypothetical protein HYS13_13090 [Planctomycetia bacterium]|nr:hypothetical protein [Planctomycetia bacterium]
MSTEVVKRKPRRRWLQFGVRSLLVLTLVAAVLFWLTTFWRPYQRQRAALDEIARLGGSYQTRPLGPSWLPEFLAKDKDYVEVTEVSFELQDYSAESRITSEDLRCLRDLRGVKKLVLPWSRDVDDGVVPHLLHLWTLESLCLESLDLSGTGVSELGRRQLAQRHRKVVPDP